MSQAANSQAFPQAIDRHPLIKRRIVQSSHSKKKIKKKLKKKNLSPTRKKNLKKIKVKIEKKEKKEEEEEEVFIFQSSE